MQGRQTKHLSFKQAFSILSLLFSPNLGGSFLLLNTYTCQPAFYHYLSVSVPMVSLVLWDGVLWLKNIAGSNSSSFRACVFSPMLSLLQFLIFVFWFFFFTDGTDSDRRHGWFVQHACMALWAGIGIWDCAGMRQDVIISGMALLVCPTMCVSFSVWTSCDKPCLLLLSGRCCFNTWTRTSLPPLSPDPSVLHLPSSFPDTVRQAACGEPPTPDLLGPCLWVCI